MALPEVTVPKERIAILFHEMGIPFNEHTVEHFTTLMQALVLYADRSESYGQVWQQYGAVSNLLSAARKVDRAMESWWWRRDGVEIPLLHKDNLDDPMDAINYLVFMIRNARTGNVTGAAPERPVIHDYGFGAHGHGEALDG